MDTATARRTVRRSDYRGPRRTLSVRVPPDIADRVTAQAEAAGLSLSDYVIRQAQLLDSTAGEERTPT